MSKTETIKALFEHLGYLFGGISLVIMSLFAVGWMMDTVGQTFGEAAMPFLASLVPFVMTLTGVAWGGYFIWKGAPGIDIAFDLICKLAGIIVLNRMSHKARVLVGGPPVFIGGIILIVAVIQAAIHLGVDGAVMGIISPLGLTGWGAILFGLVVTPNIKGRRMEQKSDKT